MAVWKPGEAHEEEGRPSDPFQERFGRPRNLSRELSRRSDRIVSLILFSDLPWIDIVLEIQRMRDLVEEEAPEMAEAFERIYAARFDRIRDQWRED